MFYYLLVFFVGFASLGGEIALARLIAPYWGTGTVIWSLVIAGVLLALSLGYYFGGKTADKFHDKKHLAKILFPGIVLLMMMPLIARIFLPGLSPVLFLLFLVIASSAFAFLGVTVPWVLRLLARDIEHTGELAGRLFAVSTIGSFLGAILTAMLLIPFLGTTRSFILLALLPVLPLFRISKVLSSVLFLLSMLLFIFSPPGMTSKNANIVWQGDSSEQHVFVLRGENGERYLQLNEGQDIHSVYRKGQVLTGDFWDAPLYLWPLASSRAPKNILILGHGAGSTSRAWKKYYQKSKIDGVEVDPLVTYAGKRFFELREDQRLRVYHTDARRFLVKRRKQYDLIFLDVHNSNQVPFYLSTQEFFKEIKKDLKPSGLLLFNINYLGQRELEKILAATTSSVFPVARYWRYSKSNSLLLLGKKPFRVIEEELLPTLLRAEAKRARREIGLPPAGGSLWTDDLAPIEMF